jgi:hypothetical protein
MKWLLLIVPCLIALAVPLFNTTSPEFFGIPFFYWFQLLMILVSTLGIYLADRMGKA